jgi:hypothetical protein
MNSQKLRVGTRTSDALAIPVSVPVYGTGTWYIFGSRDMSLDL